MNVEESYSELGLSPECSDAEIKAAWRRLAARWHPDRNASPQALRKIQRINRALEEIQRSRAAALPAAIVHAVQLTLEEALAGCTRTLHGELSEPCLQCSGSGHAAHPTECPACEGSGQVREPLWFTWVAPRVKCKACDGQGATRQPCVACTGSGQARRRYRCKVQIPPGTRNGEVLRVSIRVQGAHGKRDASLAVAIELQPHEFFQLEADGTLKCELPVDGFAWIGGGWIDVPTPAGLQQMRLKRGSLHYRMRGHGFPQADGGERADIIVTVVPLFPEECTSEQRGLLERLAASNSGHTGTEAGRQLHAWQQRVAAWQRRSAR